MLRVLQFIALIALALTFPLLVYRAGVESWDHLVLVMLLAYAPLWIPLVLCRAVQLLLGEGSRRS